jgi:hypothetical protein
LVSININHSNRTAKLSHVDIQVIFRWKLQVLW